MAQLNEKEMQLAALTSEGYTTPAELTAKLKSLFSGALEKMLEAKMDEHLSYEKHSVMGNNSGNSRNGYSKKTIKSEWGEDEISVPRDRNSTFEPQAIEKRQTRTDDIGVCQVSCGSFQCYLTETLYGKILKASLICAMYL